MEIGVVGTCTQPLEGQQAPRTAPRWTLSVDLLQAEHVGTEAAEPIAQHGQPLGHARCVLALEVESFQVVGRNSQRDGIGHLSSLPSAPVRES